MKNRLPSPPRYADDDVDDVVVLMVFVLLPLHPFDSLFSRTTWISQYQKGKTSLDLNEASDDGVQGDSHSYCHVSHTICSLDK